MPLLLADEPQPVGLLGSGAQCRDQGGLLGPRGLPRAQGLQQVGGGHCILVPPEAPCHQFQVAGPGSQPSLQCLPFLFLDPRGDRAGAVLVTHEGLEERGVERGGIGFKSWLRHLAQ